jgi:HK97 family phage major capsid protein
MTITATHRQRLEVIRERTRTARSRRQQARQRLDAAREAGDQDAQAVAQIGYDEADGELQIAERLESQLLSSMTGTNGNGHRPVGESVFEDPDTIASLERMATSRMPIGRVDLGPMVSRDDMVAMIESGNWGPTPLAAPPDVDLDPTARVGTYRGVRPQLRRRLSVLDLIGTAPMDGGSFFYSQESGSLDTAAETPEGAVKPSADLQLDDAQVVAQTIAHWARLKRAQLADVPQLGTTTQSRLTYGVLRRLEKQVIGGDGVGVNIKGILSQTGLGSIPFSAAAPLTDLVLDGSTAVFNIDADPNGVVAHPTDVATMLKARDGGSTGGRLDSGGAFAPVPTTLWGLPLVVSRAVAQGTALVGDFNQATVYVREGVTLRISDSDQDAFVRNQLVFLAEGRFGLAVWAPSAFVLVDLAA